MGHPIKKFKEMMAELQNDPKAQALIDEPLRKDERPALDLGKAMIESQEEMDDLYKNF